MISGIEPLVPRNPDGILRVIVIGRISTKHQNVENIEASYRYVKEYLAQVYDGPIDIRFLGERGSGMRTDRETIREAEDLIAKGEVDLAIAEDLSRIYRNPRHQYNFVQDSVDAGTRVICIGDNLDTADENWEVNLGAAALRHGLFIPDTRRRIRRTAKHAFENGGMVQQIKFGYRKLTAEEAATGEHGPQGLRIAKQGDSTARIREMRERVMESRNFAAVADWLNDLRIAPGPNVRTGNWTGKLVADLLRDPILSGTRRFRQVLYKPIFETGKHRRKKNPSPDTKDYPELAHMTRAEQESMWAIIDGPKNGRSDQPSAPNPRAGVPRSRAIWPGQSAVCGVCGERIWQMGEFLKCQNSLKRHGKTCWNHVQVKAEIVRDRVIDWLLCRFEADPECREAFVDSAWREIHRQDSRKVDSTAADERQVASLKREASNLANAIASGGELDALVAQLKLTESKIIELREEVDRREASNLPQCGFASRAEVAAEVDVALRCAVASSPEFAEVMRRFLPYFEIHPVQALDTGQVRPRGVLGFEFSDNDSVGAVSDDRIDLEIDFFDPPKHVSILTDCRLLRAENPKLSLRRLAERLGVSYMTVKRALKYQQLMDQEEMAQPYRLLLEPPENASRWR